MESLLGQTRRVLPQSPVRGAPAAVIIGGSLLLSWYIAARLVATESTGEVLFLLGLAGGVMLIPLLLVHLEHALAVVVFAVPLAGLTQLGSLGGRSILPFLGLFLVGGWALQLVLRQRSFRPFPELKYLLAYGAIGLASTLLAIDRNAGRPEITSHLDYINPLSAIFSVAQFLVFGIVVVQVCRAPRDKARIGWVIITSLALLAALVLAQTMLGIRIGVGIELMQYSEGFLRAGAFGGGPAALAGMLIVGIAFALSYLRLTLSLPQRLVVVSALALMALAQLASYTLAGLVGTVVAAGIAFDWRGAATVSGAARALLIALLIGGAALAASPILQSRVNGQLERFESLSPGYWFSSRVATTSGAVGVIERYPVLGVGWRQSQFYVPEYWLRPWDDRKGAHNVYLSVGAESGLPGLLAFLTLVGSALYGLRGSLLKLAQAAAEGERTVYAVARGTWAGLTGLLVFSMADDTQNMQYLWLLIAMAIAIKLWVQTQEASTRGGKG